MEHFDLRPKDSGLDKMCGTATMKVFDLDADDSLDKMCGKVFSTVKGVIVFICYFCDEKYLCCEDFLFHLSQKHLALPVSGKDRHQEKHRTDPFCSTSGNCEEDTAIEKKFDEFLECDLEISPAQWKPPEAHIKIEQTSDNESVENSVTNNLHKENTESLGTNITFNQNPKPICEQHQEEGKSKRARKSSKKISQKTNKKRKTNRALSKSNFDSAFHGRPIKCLNCRAIYLDVQEFRNHMKEHGECICPKCSRGYTSKRTFDSHMEAVRANIDCALVERPYKCEYCNFGFHLKSRLNAHLHAHFDEGNHECSECSKNFSSLRKLKLHRRTHNKEKPFKCHICGITMSDKTNMRTHIYRHSEKNKKFPCEDCTMKFFTRTELLKHSRSVHTKEHPYLCPDCGASFPVFSRLTKHKKNHHTVRERSFKCEICSQAFFDRICLKAHMVTHVEERKHICSVCGASFKLRKTLVNHLKIHENKRSYQCDLCQKGFNQRPALASHMKSVHNN